MNVGTSLETNLIDVLLRRRLPSMVHKFAQTLVLRTPLSVFRTRGLLLWATSYGNKKTPHPHCHMPW